MNGAASYVSRARSAGLCIWRPSPIGEACDREAIKRTVGIPIDPSAGG